MVLICMYEFFSNMYGIKTMVIMYDYYLVIIGLYYNHII
jgi:hypothetical protein